MSKSFLNFILSPQKIYYAFLGLFFEHSPVVNKIEVDEAYFHKLKNLEITKKIKVNCLKSQAVAMNNQNFNQSIEEKCKKYHFEPNIVKIFNLTEIFLKSIKWLSKTLDIWSLVRNYNVKIQKNSVKLNLEKTIFNVFLKNLSDVDLIISRKLRITEEIIELEPYTQKASFERFIKYPVIKSPVAKSEFSKNQTDFFREKLAAQAKTQKFNINILNVYEKFALGLFSSIKQDENTSNIICYFDKINKKISEDDIYYLVIGIKKDDNQLIKSLIKPQDLK